jgi:hypothetical protein
MATWSGSALPSAFASIYTFIRPYDPPLRIRLPVAQEQPGYFLELFDTGVHGTDGGARRLRLYESNPGVWSVEDLSLEQGNTPTSTGIEIRCPFAVPEEGQADLRSTTTLVYFIYDHALQQIHLAGVLSILAQWESVPINGLVAGNLYTLVDLNGLASKPFSASFRLGAATTSGGYVMDRGYLDPVTMVAGNSNFTVAGTVRWNDLSAPAPTADASMWILAAVAEPTPQAVTTLPTGQVVLANPDTSLQYHISLPPNASLGLQGTMTLPLPSYVAGVPILFQWVSLLGDGSAVVSDVFGSRVRAMPGSQASASSNSSLQVEGGSVPQQAGSAMTGARRWLNGLPCATNPNWLENELRRRLR